MFNFKIDGHPVAPLFVPANHDICACGPYDCTPD
jgi:hypothetical protein